MKGLLLKDAYLIGKLCKAFILLDIVLIAAALFRSRNMFYIFYPCIISGMIPMTLISYDEREKWDKYAGTLPYTRTQLVSSKYLIGLFISIVVLAFIAATQAYRMSKESGFVLKEYLTVIIMLLSVSLIAPAILYPLVFKFGAEKGRIFYFIVIGAACAGSTALINIEPHSITKFNNLTVVAIIFTVSVLLYAVSWILSVYFYKGREL